MAKEYEITPRTYLIQVRVIEVVPHGGGIIRTDFVHYAGDVKVMEDVKAAQAMADEITDIASGRKSIRITVDGGVADYVVPDWMAVDFKDYDIGDDDDEDYADYPPDQDPTINTEFYDKED